MSSNKKSNLFFYVWDIAYPFLMYYGVLTLAYTGATIIFGEDNSKYMYCQTLATVITLPVMYFSFYRIQYHEKVKISERKNIYIAIIHTILCISLGLNNVINMSPFVDMSQGYKDATAGFYGSTVAIEIIGVGILTPILEELVFRGIIYDKLKKMMSAKQAVIVSALLFGVIHFNVVQFIYAFLIGIMLAVFVDASGSVWGAIIAHICSNVFAVLRTEYHMLDGICDGSVLAWVVSIVILLAGIAGCSYIIRHVER